MNARRGFALPAVLGALVIMAMLVAVTAQHALMAARNSALHEAHVLVAASVETALAEAFAREVDTLALRAAPAGAVIDSGRSRVGGAAATWRMTAALAPVALLSVEATAPVRGGSARAVTRVWLRCSSDPPGASRWRAGRTGWWSQFPAS